MKLFNNYFIVLIWLVNGLVCRIFNLVPRQGKIVEQILEFEYFGNIMICIGILEVFVGFSILSRLQSKVNAVIQIILITTINIFEFFLAPELLLWGQFNAFFALVFVIFIYLNELNDFKLSTTKN